MKIALITDTHWGARNDSLAFLEYFHKFYDNIFFPYLEREGIQTILHLGDIVDRRKYINYTVLNRLKSSFLTPIMNAGIDLHVIIGNHDVPFRNTNEINSMNELLGGYGFDKINYYPDPITVNFDGCDMCLLPWINRSNYSQSMEEIKNTKAQVVMGHLEIEGFLLMRGVMNDHGLHSSLFDRFDVVCSGHFHHKHTKKNVTYLGSPYEIFWSDYNDNRGFHIFDTETRELEFVKNPYHIFKKHVYEDTDKTMDQLTDIDYSLFKDCYVKVIVQTKTNPYAFDLLLDKLYKSDPAHVSIVDDHKHLDQKPDEEIFSETEDTLTILTKYVDNLEFDGDNKALNSLLRNLYQEAQHVEI